MKRAVMLILVVLAAAFMNSCYSDGSADIWIFAESFNNQDTQYKIDLPEVTAISNEDGSSEYECFIKTESGKTILLTLFSEKDGTVSSFSVTASDGDKTTCEAFCKISESAAGVLVSETDEDITVVFDSLGMKIPGNLKKAGTKYYDTAVCSYSLASNTEGVTFIAALQKYSELTEKPLSLRETVEEKNMGKTETESRDLSESASG
jgi:hypothetical protein